MLLGIAVVLLAASVAKGADWRQFRGTDNTAVAEDRELPLTFGQQENVAWKAALPGRGPSSPIVVSGRVLVTCSSGARQDRLHLLCFDTQSGKQLWQRQLWATGSTVHHPFGAVACNTPASDGQRVLAFYSSNDLACFDLDGNLQWFRGLAFEHPAVRNDTAMASSPLVVGGTVVVQMDNLADPLVLGLDAASGKTLWSIQHPAQSLWSSPTVLRPAASQGNDSPLVLLQSRDALTVHDPATGRQLASYDHFCDTIASVATCGDRIFLPAAGVHALRYDPAAGRLQRLWEQPKLRGGNASPLAHAGRVYAVKDGSILVCGDWTDGHVIWQLRLKGPIWATPVLAGEHLYVVNHEGLVQVVRVGGEQGELVGSSQIEAGILASPAVADGAIYFRSDSQLWKVSRDRHP